MTRDRQPDPRAFPDGSPAFYRSMGAWFRWNARDARRKIAGPTPAQFDHFDEWMERYATAQEALADLVEREARP